MYRKAKGVTLIEVMIVVVIVAILASIAIPAYGRYVLRAQRSDAMSALLRVAANQEKFYLQNNTYADDAASVGGATSEKGWYTIEVDGDENGFTATATPVAGSPQAKDTECTSFTINETGQRGASNTTCWR
jgi:type IV pilus assembly protein PilE